MTNFPCWAHQTVLKFVFTHLLEWSIFACQIDPWCGKLDPGTSCRSNDAYKANTGQTGKTKCFDKTDHQPLPCGTLYALSTLVPQINCPVTMHQCLHVCGCNMLCVRHAKRHPGISNPHQYAAPEICGCPVPIGSTDLDFGRGRLGTLDLVGLYLLNVKWVSRSFPLWQLRGLKSGECRVYQMPGYDDIIQWFFHPIWGQLAVMCLN